MEIRSASRVRLKTKTFAFRRCFVTSLATREKMRLRTKLIIAVSIFVVSYATKSLQAVDLVPVMYTVEQPFGGLTETYDLRAVSILEGGGVLGPYEIDPSRTVWLAQAPGYSIYLSGVYRITGRDFFRVQSIQNAINSISPILIFLIAGSVVSWRVGVASGLLAAISHHLSHISNFILPDSICALPLLAAAYVLVIATRHGLRSYWLWILAGVLIGTSAWLRSQIMLGGIFLSVVLVIVAFRRLATLKRVAFLLLASLLVIAPITIRNYVVYGEFVPVQIGVGLNLWEGIADASGDRFGAVRLDQEVAAQEALLYDKPRYAGTWSSPDGIRRDRDRVKKSLDIVFQHPVWYAGVMLKRMREMVKYSAHAPLVFKIDEARARQRTLPIKPGWESLAADPSSLGFGRSIFWMRPVVRALQRLVKEPMFYFVLLGAALMLLASWQRALFLGMVPLYYLLFQSFMHTEFRYTLPMQYFVFVFAATIWVLLAGWVWAGLRIITKRYLSRPKPGLAG